MTPGRTCPLSYRYGPRALANAPTRQAQTLYVVGGLYGNVQALDALDDLIAQESGPVTVCFNGDFNWFNVAPHTLREINTRVLAHDAIAGNVEVELCTALDDAGCGCAYPESVAAAVVERSNRIHARLKSALLAHPDLRAALNGLPMLACYQIGSVRVGVVHGDAQSLAGWDFDRDALANAHAHADDALNALFRQAKVDVFASSHTCVPALKKLSGGVVINNGAAGMPNFSGRRQGLVTRISTQPSPHTPVYGVVHQGVRHGLHHGVYVQALALPYDADRWEQEFLAQWPPGSDAHLSYFDRIQGRLAFEPAQALV